MTDTLKKEFATLSLAEKIQTIEDLWDLVAHETEGDPMPKALLAELEQRAKAFDANPSLGLILEEVEKSLFPSK
jgi:putative addiction module component (TIGR02574 family)